MPELTPQLPLKIVVLGAGKIGSTFAFYLSRTGGHDVTVIARPDSLRLRQLKRDYGVVTATGELADIEVTDSLDEQVSYDLLIVTSLDQQTATILPALRRSAAKSSQFMFNTFTQNICKRWLEPHAAPSAWRSSRRRWMATANSSRRLVLAGRKRS